MDIRKKFLSAQLFLFAFCASAYAGWTPADGLRLKSPDKKIEISVNQDANGLFYTVKKGKTSVLDKSPLGIIVDGNDLGKGVSFVDEPEITKIDEEYPIFGNHAVAEDKAVEAWVSLEASGVRYGLVVRAYNDGVAVRYVLPDGAKHIGGERTTWTLPQGVKKVAWAEYDPGYERYAHVSLMDGVADKEYVAGPITVELEKGYATLAEADCEAYPDMAFAREGNAFRSVFPASDKGWDIKRLADESDKVLSGTYKGKNVSHNSFFVALDYSGNLIAVLMIYGDPVKNLEAGLLTHGLYLAYDLSYEAFLDELFRKIRVKDYRNAVVLNGDVAFLLSCINEQVAFLKNDLRAVDDKAYLAVCLELVHKRRSVNLGESRSDLGNELAVLGSEGTKLGLELICHKSFHIVGKLDLLYVELVKNDLGVHFGESSLSLDIHGSDGLSVLDVGLVSCRASKHYDLKDEIHIILKLLVDPFLVGFGEVAQMNALGSGSVYLDNDISVYFLGDIRRKRCRYLGKSRKHGIKRHIGVYLILRHSACPETLAASPYIPVAHVVHEALKRSGGLCYLIAEQALVHIFNKGLKL